MNDFNENSGRDFGDSDFDDFLRKNVNDGNGLQDCQKRLLFDIVSQKTDVLGGMLPPLVELYKLKRPVLERKKHREKVDKLINKLLVDLDESVAQLDYAMTLVLDEMGVLNDDDKTPPEAGK